MKNHKLNEWVSRERAREKKGKNLPFKSFVNWDRVDMIARRFVYCEWDDDDVNVDCNSFSTQFFLFFTHTRARTHTHTRCIRFATFIRCILLFSVYFFSLCRFFFCCLFKTTQTFRGACVLQTKFPVQNFNFEFKRCGFLCIRPRRISFHCANIWCQFWLFNGNSTFSGINQNETLGNEVRLKQLMMILLWLAVI